MGASVPGGEQRAARDNADALQHLRRARGDARRTVRLRHPRPADLFWAVVRAREIFGIRENRRSRSDIGGDRRRKTGRANRRSRAATCAEGAYPAVIIEPFGIVKLKRLPAPSALSTQSSPP